MIQRENVDSRQKEERKKERPIEAFGDHKQPSEKRDPINAATTLKRDGSGAAQASHGSPGVAANQPGPAYEALRRPGNGIVQEPHEPYDCQQPDEIRYHGL